jgi:hypothetical protein
VNNSMTMIKADPPTVEILVREGSINRYTILLQSGVDIGVPGRCSIGEFLDHLPGFTEDYVTNRVQTIFLNGTAMDNLATLITGTNPVLAISAAMPGLAGAIFRRNSVHAALRSKSAPAPGETGQNGTVAVKLKLFNMIATEKGEALLAQGVGVTGNGLAAFLSDHPTLFASITRTVIAGREVKNTDLIERLQNLNDIYLRVRQDDDE